MAPQPLMPEIDFGLDPLPDLYPRLARLRATGRPVVPVRYFGGVAWIVLGHEDVGALFQNEAAIPAADAYQRTGVPALGRILMALQGDEHRMSRALVAGTLLPSTVRRLAAQLLVPLANRLIDDFGERRSVDLAADFATLYPFRVISRMLGIPVEGEAAVLRLLHRIIRYTADPEDAITARGELDAVLVPAIEARRTDPGDDTISQLLAAEIDGQRLDDEAILAFLRLLYPAGNETTALTLASLLWEVLRDPAVCQRLISEPALRTAAVEEALRLHAPATMLPRFTLNGIGIAGVAIPPMSFVLASAGSANHDPALFAEPERFRLDRGANPHLSFGKGIHFCLGAHLAREELKTALALLLDRLPGLRLAPDAEIAETGVITRGVRHLPVQFDRVLPPIVPVPRAERVRAA